MATYHVGLAIRKHALVIQAARSVDYLSCEIYDYMGRRETTEARLREKRYGILAMMQAKKPDVYGKLRYAIVE